MSKRLITDDMLESALHYLATSSDQIASARANRVRAEFNRKRLRAKLILQSPEKSQGLREAWAESSDAYQTACELEADWVEKDEFHRSERNKAEVIVETWRSENANNRAGSNFR
jgi:hypothetical protein